LKIKKVRGYDMNNSVIIKSNRYGIIVVLDKNVDFDELLLLVAEKFKESGSFFKGSKMAVSFEGRSLSVEEEKKLVDTISENSEIDIACIIDLDKEKEEAFKQAVEERMAQVAPSSEDGGQFYRGTLRSGQSIEAGSSIIILGDVNPGATVVAAGNVVVLGSLKGIVYAGGNGDEKSFVVALDMDPMQIRIGDVIARCSDEIARNVRRYKRKSKSSIMQPQIAFVEDNNIYIESITKDILKDISE